MESYSVTFYEKFSVLSVVMPYYDFTHKCFLLISTLCKGSRNTLLQWYEEFTKIMQTRWKTFTWEYPFDLEFPPWDMFQFDFNDDVQMFCHIIKFDFPF